MQFAEKNNTIRWIIIAFSFFITVLILWNTYIFFQIFKNEERTKMEFWAEAQRTLLQADVFTDVELPLKIISHNTTLPILLTNEKDSIINGINIDENILKDQKLSQNLLETLKKENEPIAYEYVPGSLQYLYYGNSSLLNQLKYYPIALLLIIVLFAALVYNFYRSNRMSAQNKLWAGMAKETAHQIGTPLSSLLGWIEIMKADDIDEMIVSEIEIDINRLQTIADRFSKIGSAPVLERIDVAEETQKSFEYLTSRFSKQVVFTFKSLPTPVLIDLNAALHSWTIENLVKNAIDAMKGRGSISVLMEEDANFVKILVSDTGKGIPKNQFKNIFEPGFTTKKRGWGLGLSLTKRIVEEYHKGRIKVLKSEIGKGTTIQISYKKMP
jgi:two-component system, sporulation sensor kinase D